MMNETLADAEVAKYLNDNYLILKVNVDENEAAEELLSANNLRNFPGMIITHPDGTSPFQYDWYMDKTDFMIQLKKYNHAEKSAE